LPRGFKIICKMTELSRQNLSRIYKELDQVGVAISVAGTRRQKLMKLARLAIPISDALVGARPETKRVRDDLVRLAHNVRRAQTRPRPASKAISELASQIKIVQKLVDSGLGNVPKMFVVDKMTILNNWGYTNKEVKPFLDALKIATDKLGQMGLADNVGAAQVTLDPRESFGSSMKYVLFLDAFAADPLCSRDRFRGISDAIGGRLWMKLFEQRDVETWGGSTQAWGGFSSAFYKLLRGKKISGDDAAKMAVSLGRVIGPEKWRKVA